MGEEWCLISGLAKSKCDCKPQSPQREVQTPVMAQRPGRHLCRSFALTWSAAGCGLCCSLRLCSDQQRKQEEGLEGT